MQMESPSDPDSQKHSILITRSMWAVLGESSLEVHHCTQAQSKHPVMAVGVMIKVLILFVCLIMVKQSQTIPA